MGRRGGRPSPVRRRADSSLMIDAASERVVRHALRHPRGRYPAGRASQLSGVPRSTLVDWRREGNYVPDFDGASPVAWSYRDLVYLRLLAWLRQLGMPRQRASERVGAVRRLVAGGAEIRSIRTDGRTLALDDDGAVQPGDRNLSPFDEFLDLLRPFDLLDPIDELRRRGSHRVWGPDLVTPSEHTFIAPWVLAGEPCVERTRIPTAAVYALHEERGLSARDIVKLYPGLTVTGADDAYVLERRLRGFDLPSPVAAGIPAARQVATIRSDFDRLLGFE